MCHLCKEAYVFDCISTLNAPLCLPPPAPSSPGAPRDDGQLLKPMEDPGHYFTKASGCGTRTGKGEFCAYKIITFVESRFAPGLPSMASVFSVTIIFLWEKSLRLPHSDAGKLNAAASSQIHTTSHRPQSSLLAHTGGVSSKLRKVRQHWSEMHCLQERREKNHREKGMLCLGDSFRVLS